MDTVVWILILLTAFNFLLKQSFWRPVATCVAAGIAALFVVLVWPLAIEQSKTQIADWLSDNQLMLDTSVVLTVELSLQMAFCLLSVHVANYSPVKPRMRWMYKALYWFPGVLVLLVLFFGLTQTIFTFPGMSFRLLAWLFAAFVLVAVPLGRWLIKRLLPEPELRLELFFLTNALAAVLGIIATVNGQTAVAGTTTVDWVDLGGCVALFVAGALAGWIIFIVKRKLTFKIRK